MTTFFRFPFRFFRGAILLLKGALWSFGERIRRYFRLRRHARIAPFPILGNNCIAGRLCHDLGWPFLSPTVNLWMSVRDFVEMVELYVRTGAFPKIMDATEKHSARYPVGITESGETIHFLHYKSFEEAIGSWNRRLARLTSSKQKPILVVSDNSDCSPEDISRFLALPFKKRMVVHDLVKKSLLGDCGVYLPLDPKFGTNIARKTGWTGKWVYQDPFPVTWLLVTDAISK